MQAEKERKLPPQHPAPTNISGAPSKQVAFRSISSFHVFLSFFLFSDVQWDQQGCDCAGGSGPNFTLNLSGYETNWIRPYNAYGRPTHTDTCAHTEHPNPYAHYNHTHLFSSQNSSQPPTRPLYKLLSWRCWWRLVCVRGWMCTCAPLSVCMPACGQQKCLVHLQMCACVCVCARGNFWWFCSV